MQVSIEATDRGRGRAHCSAGCRPRSAAASRSKTPQGVGDDISKQLQALDMVLYFFAGVALFVGGFLILNAFNMTVLQRTRELGMLRTLGATAPHDRAHGADRGVAARADRVRARARARRSGSPSGSRS